MAVKHFDTLVVGSGFASTFFLHEYLKWAPETERVVVLERGLINNATPGKNYAEAKGMPFHKTMINLNPSKVWVQRLGFGGGTCWTGNSPRMHPNDFRTASLYGRGKIGRFNTVNWSPIIAMPKILWESAVAKPLCFPAPVLIRFPLTD